MNDKIIDYYDKESSMYSLKRYESFLIDFTQYYFRKRLSILLAYLDLTILDKNDLSLLEIGCADGIIIRKIEEKFNGIFKEMVGTDISPKMIEEARKTNSSKNVSYFLRGQDNPNSRYDFVLEVGVLSPVFFEKEFPFVQDKLNNGGYFICSLPSKYSLRAFFKSSKDSFSNTNFGFREYEKVISQYFNIINKETYGLFIPKLWKFPLIARTMQPVLEAIFKYIVPGLFHERIYLLQKKD